MSKNTLPLFVYVAILEDRHCDVQVEVFSEKEDAVEWAEEAALLNAHHEEDIEKEELTAGMRKEGWLYYAVYSCEGDSVRVVQKEVDAEVVADADVEANPRA